MPAERPLQVVFFKTEAGNEPVREWLKDLSREDSKTIGSDILTVQYAWPVESRSLTIWAMAFGRFDPG